MMRTDVQDIALGEDLALPRDLTEWRGAAELRESIVKEVETLHWANPAVVEYLRGHPAYQPKMLLCLLTFAYATGVHDSEEIVRRCVEDESFRAICGSRAPMTAKAIIRFRRENRGLLKWCLVQLFKGALQEKLGDLLLPAGVKRHLVDAAVGRLDLARQIDRGSESL